MTAAGATASRPPGLGPTRGVAVHFRGVVHLYPSPEGDVLALKGVDLEVSAGETLGVLGPSGAGKSTLLALLAGSFPPSVGAVIVGDQDLAKLSEPQLSVLRAHEISLVVQGAENNLIPYATFAENVWFAQRGAVRRGRPPVTSADQLATSLGLEDLADIPVERMASGQRQLVAVAVGVAVEPRLLLLDEPTSRLDPPTRDAVVALILRVARDFGVTVVTVTHDPDVAGAFSRTVTISDGRVGSSGRQGREYVVVGRSGLVQLPHDVLDLVPPDSLVEVVRMDDAVQLRRVDLEAASDDAEGPADG